MTAFKNFFKPDINRQCKEVIKELQKMGKEIHAKEENRGKEISLTIVHVEELNRSGFCFYIGDKPISDVLEVMDENVLDKVARNLKMR